MRNKFLFAYILEIPNFLSLFIFAFFMMAASPVLIEISKTLKVSPESMNLIITYFMIGVAAGVISNIFLTRWFKNKHIMIFCYILLIPIMVGLSIAGSITTFYVLYLLSGFMVGIIWIHANTNMVQGSVNNKESVVSIGHVFFALGALTSPLVASNLIAGGFGWKIIYYIVIFLVVISLLLYLIFEKLKKNSSQNTSEKFAFNKIFKNRSKNIFLILSLVIIAFYFILETIIITWFPTFLRLGKSFDIFQAGYTISIFWVGMLTGRLILSVLSYKVRSDYILFGLCILSLIALSIAIFSDLNILNYIGIGFAGLGFSGFVPLMISSSSSIFKSGKDIILAILFSLGLISNSLGPVITKIVSEYNLVMSVAISIIFMFIVGLFITIRYFYQKIIR